MLAMGVDGARVGRISVWVAVVLEDGRYADSARDESLEGLCAQFDELSGIAMDMPLGWVDGIRKIDGLVRQLLPGRAAAVFNAPPAAISGAASSDED